ncbi:hypothetical protein X975_00021, partial [Stegodyphus mimosarum]
MQVVNEVVSLICCENYLLSHFWGTLDAPKYIVLGFCYYLFSYHKSTFEGGYIILSGIDSFEIPKMCSTSCTKIRHFLAKYSYRPYCFSSGSKFQKWNLGYYQKNMDYMILPLKEKHVGLVLLLT